MQRFLKRKYTEQEESESAKSLTETTSSVPMNAKRPAWKNDRPWLHYENAKIYCSYCKEYGKSSVGNKFVSGCDSLQIENVRSHEASSAHKISHSTFLNSKKSTAEQPIYKAILNMEKHGETTAFYIGKHERPYTEFEKLNELQAKNYGDEKTAQHYNNDKQAKEFIHYIAKSEQETAQLQPQPQPQPHPHHLPLHRPPPPSAIFIDIFIFMLMSFSS